MELKTVLAFLILPTVIMSIIIYIANDVLYKMHQPIDWMNVTDVGAPLPITPMLFLTIIVIILLAVVIAYLNGTVMEKSE